MEARLYFSMVDHKTACHSLSKAFLKSMKKWYRFCWCWRSFFTHDSEVEDLGPVVQSIVSLTRSLRGQLVKCFTIYYQIHIYVLLREWEKLFQCKSFSRFSTKNNGVFQISSNVWNFNETLTNDVVNLNNQTLSWSTFSGSERSLFFRDYLLGLRFKLIQDDSRHNFARMTNLADGSVVLAEL